MKNFVNKIADVVAGSVLSYSQVFFSKSSVLAIFIMLITFIFPSVGLVGLIAIVAAQVLALLLNLNGLSLKSGYYGYNALLVGLGLGSSFELSWVLIVIAVFAGFFTLFIHILIEGILHKYRLPSLSIPFVLSLMILELALRNNPILHLSEHSIYSLNTIFSYGGVEAVNFFDFFNNQFFPSPLKYFFVSVGSIFFMDNAFSGFIVFMGLLFFSRIASTLAILGFLTAYYFMQFIGIDTSQMTPFFVGYNFILTTIAVAGYYLIPSLLSYLWALMLVPITVLLTFGLSRLLEPWQLPIYSLPFNMMVLLSVYILYFRNHSKSWLAETYYQEFMPEKNLYSYQNYIKRFGRTMHNVQILLPFWGQWTVWQGYNGKITHKDNFRFALDFVITFDGSTYRNQGLQLSDYYCYNKIVVSPGYGIVVKIVDGIPDNAIGDVNTIQNWGNTIVIKHAENLYSQLNHLLSGSFKVKEGDYVFAGQPIANVGNSGRSPQPHLHFQLQQYPFVGSYTIEYPVSRFFVVKDNQKILKSFEVPKENEIIENISINTVFSNAFHFIPGQIIEVVEQKNNQKKVYEWEVLTDSLNNTYIYCKTSNSVAYIHNDGLSHFFKSFAGQKKSALYYFYKTCYHIEFSNVVDFQIDDLFPLHYVYPFTVLFLHDFFAPFFSFLKAKYSLYIPKKYALNEIQLKVKLSNTLFNKSLKTINAIVSLSQQGISKITIYEKQEITLHFAYKQRFA